MRLPRVLFTTRRLMLAIAVLAAVFGGLQLWQRAQFYRRQAALCALIEEDYTWYADGMADHPGLTAEEKQEDERGNRLEASRHGALKVVYARLASHPWEYLLPGTPSSVNPWDYDSLSTWEIEEEVKARLDEKAAGKLGQH
jgi:hypothetical protein